jgi:DNA polymerase III subunit epsilon
MTRRIITFGDTETTGLNEPNERIIETCLMQYDLDTEEHIKTWVWRSKPDCKIGAKAQKVHGISMADLVNEPDWSVVAPHIRGVIEPSIGFVAHNGDEFDIPFIDREMRRVGIIMRWPKTFDTMQQARWATHNGKLPRLGELAEALDVSYDPDQAHSAEYDVYVMAQSFFEGRRIGWFDFQP